MADLENNHPHLELRREEPVTQRRPRTMTRKLEDVRWIAQMMQEAHAGGTLVIPPEFHQ